MPETPDELQRLLPLTPAVFFVLFVLADGDKHGYAIMQETSKLSAGKVRMGPGTLYATLQRLLELSLICEVPRPASEHDTRRRYYRLKPTGKALLESEIQHMDAVLRAAQRKLSA
jgi:DNA-binding PadR family transcriptional regulator